MTKNVNRIIFFIYMHIINIGKCFLEIIVNKTDFERRTAMSIIQIWISMCMTFLGILISLIPGCVYIVRNYGKSMKVRLYVIIYIIVMLVLLIYLINQNPAEIRQLTE